MLTYCLKRNDNTENIGLKNVAMIRAKSKCAACMGQNFKIKTFKTKTQ